MIAMFYSKIGRELYWSELMMNERLLSVGEIIRFTNHDFLNELQLMSMHLQLGNVEAVYERIERFQQQSKQTSQLSKIQLPKTVEWLLTAHWRFPALQFNIVNESSNVEEVAFDELLASYLEHTVIHVYDTLDPFEEHAMSIRLKNAPHFTVEIELQGKWQMNEALQYANSEYMSINIIEQNEEAIKVIFNKE